MNKTTKVTTRRISETYSEESTIGRVNLNAIAAELPPELEGQWIVKVVRSFGRFRGITRDEALRDMFQEAVGAAIKAGMDAERKGGNVEAYVKRAVRSRLADLQRCEDYRDMRLVNDDTKIMAGGSRSDFKAALMMISPRAKQIWRAWKRAGGLMAGFAAELGTSKYLAETRYLPILVEEMREALAYVKFIRRG